MSEQTDRDAGAAVPEVEEDHDLLTLEQASDRLGTAIAEEQARLAAAEAAGDTAAMATSRTRVAQLQAAAVRHRRVPITAVNAAQFYGFDADEQRSTSA